MYEPIKDDDSFSPIIAKLQFNRIYLVSTLLTTILAKAAIFIMLTNHQSIKADAFFIPRQGERLIQFINSKKNTASENIIAASYTKSGNKLFCIGSKPEINFKKYTVPMLKEELRKFNLPLSGKKANLIDRLVSYHNECVKENISIRNIGPDTDNQQCFEKSKSSLSLMITQKRSKQEAEDDEVNIKQLLQEFNEARSLGKSDNAEVIHSMLLKKYDISIQEELKLWSVGGYFVEEEKGDKGNNLMLTKPRGVYTLNQDSSNESIFSEDDQVIIEAKLMDRYHSNRKGNYKSAEEMKSMLLSLYDGLQIDDKLCQYWYVSTSLATGRENSNSNLFFNNLEKCKHENQTFPSPIYNTASTTAKITSIANDDLTKAFILPSSLGDELHSLKLPELKERLRNANLPVSGNKNILIERLLSHYGNIIDTDCKDTYSGDDDDGLFDIFFQNLSGKIDATLSSNGSINPQKEKKNHASNEFDIEIRNEDADEIADTKEMNSINDQQYKGVSFYSYNQGKSDVSLPKNDQTNIKSKLMERYHAKQQQDHKLVKHIEFVIKALYNGLQIDDDSYEYYITNEINADDEYNAYVSCNKAEKKVVLPTNIDETITVPEIVPNVEELRRLPLAILQEKLLNVGLPVSGSREILIERLIFLNDNNIVSLVDNHNIDEESEGVSDDFIDSVTMEQETDKEEEALFDVFFLDLQKKLDTSASNSKNSFDQKENLERFPLSISNTQDIIDTSQTEKENQLKLLQNLTISSLKEMLRDAKLPVSGNKAVLVNRLLSSFDKKS